jgi:hypothetical protein
MNARPLAIGVAVMLAIALLMGGYLWRLRARASAPASSNYVQPVAPPPANGPSEQVTLYVADDAQGMLLPQKNTVALPTGRQGRAEELLRTLTTIYLQKSSPHPLGPGSELRNVYLLDSGLAVIDVNADFANGHRSGVLVEELTIASLVETLSANVPGIVRVKILVEGAERETLSGHADLTGTYYISSVVQMANALEPE